VLLIDVFVSIVKEYSKVDDANEIAQDGKPHKHSSEYSQEYHINQSKNKCDSYRSSDYPTSCVDIVYPA